MIMKANRRRATPGDTLEVETTDGLYYLRYVGRHHLYGDVVFVDPTKHFSRPADLRQLFQNGYIAFYPVNLAILHGLVKVIQRGLRGTTLEVPMHLRRPGALVGRRIATWFIEDGSREVVKENLTTEELTLPIAEVWSHETLLYRLEEGWRPEWESSELSLMRSSPEDTVTSRQDDLADSEQFKPQLVVTHYLYFPTQKAAKRAEAELKMRGFQTEIRLGADGINWLVLARNEVPASAASLDDARQVMETLSSKMHGQYDGWESESQQ